MIYLNFFFSFRIFYSSGIFNQLNTKIFFFFFKSKHIELQRLRQQQKALDLYGAIYPLLTGTADSSQPCPKSPNTASGSLSTPPSATADDLEGS